MRTSTGLYLNSIICMTYALLSIGTGDPGLGIGLLLVAISLFLYGWDENEKNN